MIQARRRLRELLSSPGCTLAAPVFDPLSARVAESGGWTVGKLSGSVSKAAELGVPDGVALANMSDLVSICQRITRASSISLLVDADDGGGGPVVISRTVRELEAAGVAGVEVEDNSVPHRLDPHIGRHSLLLPVEEHVGRLRAAVAARCDPDLVIVARTAAVEELPFPRALERVAAYASAGVDAIMLPRYPVGGRNALIELHGAGSLPLFVLNLPPDVAADQGFLATNQIRMRYVPQYPFRRALSALEEAYRYLASEADVHDAIANTFAQSDGIFARITRVAELARWERRFTSAESGSLPRPGHL